MPTIVMLNQKGGVGKTSTTHHLAGTLVKMGRKVLLLDNDPQASLTQGFFGPAETRSLPIARTIAACYAGMLPDLSDLVQTIHGIDLVPGSRHASRYNVPCPDELDYESRHAIKGLLHGAAHYDFTIIDCPPNLHLCSWAAMVAADSLIVPLQAEDYGAQGLLDIRDSVAMVRGSDNPSLRTLGYLITMFHARKTLHRQYEETLRTVYGDAVFETTIPNSIDFPESIANRKSIAEYKPKGASAKAMQSLANEIITRDVAPCNTEAA